MPDHLIRQLTYPYTYCTTSFRQLKALILGSEEEFLNIISTICSFVNVFD